jgi:hypothetical protein
MQFTSSFLRALPFLFAVSSVTALSVCQSGEIGVGTSQICNIDGGGPFGGLPPCDANQGALFANDCSELELSSSDDYCASGYEHGSVVTCGDNSAVTGVVYGATGQSYGNCYVLSGGSGNGDCSVGPGDESFADYCCVPL